MHISFSSQHWSMMILQAVGPQCNLYVPAPILRLGKNVLVWEFYALLLVAIFAPKISVWTWKYYLIQVILELESPNRDAVVYSIDRPDFTCGSSNSNLSQLLSHQRSLGLWIWYEGITWNEWWIPYDLFVIGIVSNSRVSCFSYSTKGKIFYGYR